MLAMVLTLKPRMRLPSSSASSAVVTWSRPCVSERNASLRSDVHFTGRFSIRAAAAHKVYSG